MSISIAYKFEIKSKTPKKLLEDLFNNTYPRINFEYIKQMPKKLLKEITYDNWANDTFGYSYKWNIDRAYIKRNKAVIEIEGNKTCYNLEPWFEKFKDNLEVYLFTEFDSSATPINDYIHFTYKNNEIVKLSRSDELGIEFNKILKTNNKQKLIDYLTKEFDFPEEFSSIDLDIIITRFISIFPILYKYLTDKYKDDKTFIKKVINNNANLYKYLDKKMQEDRKIIIKTLKSKNKFNYNESEYLYWDIHKIIQEKYDNDLELIELLVKKCPKYFKEYINIFNDNKEVALCVLGVNYTSRDIFDMLSPRLKKDIDIAKKCCQFEPYSRYEKDFIKIYSDNKDIALYALNYTKKSDSSYECVLGKLSDRLKNDEEVVKKSLDKQPNSFQYIGEKFKNDHNISIKALKNNWDNIQYIGDNLLNDYDFCKEVIKLIRRNKDSYHDGWRIVLQYLKNEKIIYDKKFVLEAINNGAILWSYNSVFNRYIDDEEIMINALIQDDYLYMYLPEEYRDNETYTIAALTNPKSAEEISKIEYTADIIKELSKGTFYQGIISQINSSIFKEAGNNLKYASNRLKNDKKIVLYAISQTPSSFIYASQKLKEDRDILKAVIPLEDFDNMKTDEIIYELITANPSLYNYYSIKYRKNYDLILKVIENYENYDYNFNLMIPFNKMSEKQLIVIYKKIVSKWKIYFKELPYKYRQNRSIVLEAIKAYGNNLQYASKTLKNDKELIEIARNQMKKYNKYEDFYLD